MAVNYFEMNRSVLNVQINNIIKQLLECSLSSNDIQGLSDQLYEIYSNNTDFRHEYSAISSILVDAIQSWTPKNKKDLPPTMILEANLSALTQNYKERYSATPESANSKNAIKQFNKLCDHINLETVRLNYMIDIKSDLRDSKKVTDDFLATKNHVQEIEKEIGRAHV